MVRTFLQSRLKLLNAFVLGLYGGLVRSQPIPRASISLSEMIFLNALITFGSLSAVHICSLRAFCGAIFELYVCVVEREWVVQ